MVNRDGTQERRWGEGAEGGRRPGAQGARACHGAPGDRRVDGRLRLPGGGEAPARPGVGARGRGRLRQGRLACASLGVKRQVLLLRCRAGGTALEIAKARTYAKEARKIDFEGGG